MTLRWRKKPVVVEAFRYAINEQPGWFVASCEAGLVRGFDPIVIRTLEGEMTARGGDWIIRGVQGEIYPCKHDIFTATYEPAEPES